MFTFCQFSKKGNKKKVQTRAFDEIHESPKPIYVHKNIFLIRTDDATTLKGSQLGTVNSSSSSSHSLRENSKELLVDATRD